MNKKIGYTLGVAGGLLLTGWSLNSILNAEYETKTGIVLETYEPEHGYQRAMIQNDTNSFSPVAWDYVKVKDSVQVGDTVYREVSTNTLIKLVKNYNSEKPENNKLEKQETVKDDAHNTP